MNTDKSLKAKCRCGMEVWVTTDDTGPVLIHMMPHCQEFIDKGAAEYFDYINLPTLAKIMRDSN